MTGRPADDVVSEQKQQPSVIQRQRYVDSLSRCLSDEFREIGPRMAFISETRALTSEQRLCRFFSPLMALQIVTLSSPLVSPERSSSQGSTEQHGSSTTCLQTLQSNPQLSITSTSSPSKSIKVPGPKPHRFLVQNHTSSQSKTAPVPGPTVPSNGSRSEIN
ncbi:hypothetical protein BIW11_03553 [Tropilaelaps mercedesae]|uniref:Uncharacterized protein n=1 Tax=Tropilaelaps mercedesae TaxID=418985 RepID=A0A1V9XJ66_9ACAR|nr:hypothetical protein BIW11_03553 [Tropilaelaps mercedesae]